MPSGPLALLNNRAFRTYWLGQSISMTGTWMQVMAQGWVLTALSDDAWVFGLFNVVGSAPMLLLGPRGGEIADRLDKRRVLLVTQVVMMVLALLFAALVFAGFLQLWHIFVLCFLVGIAEAFEFPASQGLAPELVEPEQIPQAVGMMQAIFHGGRLVGPAVAGVLIARFGEGSAFLANGLSFLAVIVSLVLITPARAGSLTTTVQDGGNFREGFSYVQEDRICWGLLGMMCLAMILAFPFLVLLSYYARHVIHVDAVGMGSLLSASGVGALVGALVILFAPPSSWMLRLWSGVLGIVAALIGLASTQTLAVASPLVAVLSFSTTQMMGTVNQTVQARIPGELRGRVMALFGMAFTSILPVSAMIVTALADVTGVPRLMVVCAVIYLGCSAVLMGRLQRLSFAA